jgi:D-inositol-3-phosphate glycosyltransferase
MTPVALLSVHTCPLAALGGKETGGMNVYVREVGRALGRLGVPVDVFTRSQDRSVPEVVPLGDNARVIHVRAGPVGPLARAAVQAHVPEFVEGVERFRRGEGATYALLHSHYWLSGLAALELRRRWGAPVVHMFHTLGAIKNAVARGSDDVEPADRLAAEQRIAVSADRLVASNLVERADLAWHCGADPARVRVIPCGVDLDLFCPGDGQAARARVGLGPGRVLLFVGRLTPIKGLEVLLSALARVRARRPADEPLRLVVVGGDKEEPWAGEGGRFRRMARDLGLQDCVEFRGPQPQGVLPDYYRAADVCLMPSRYESFGMVALEAMACGVPVVASRVGGLAALVQDGVTGVLVPEGAPEPVAVAVTALLGGEARRRTLGAQAAEWARRFAWPAVARCVLDVYADLVPAMDRGLRPPVLCRQFL